MNILSAKKLVAAIVLTIGLVVPGVASAHPTLTGNEAAGAFGTRVHPPKAPNNLRVANITHDTVTISYEAGHSHDVSYQPVGNYWLSVFYKDNSRIESECTHWHHHNNPGAPLCFRRTGVKGQSRYSETISGLSSGFHYKVFVVQVYRDSNGNVNFGWNSILDFQMMEEPLEPVDPGFDPPTEPETPSEPETPDPETPTEPETPEPETPNTPEPDCTYKHRLIGVPGTTGAGFTSQILISSEASNATATITAYQADNGHQIDVLDSDGSAIGSTTSLAPAHSVKVFRLEDARGWHTVIVEHPTARAMRRATVAMRLREPDTGVSIILAERIEDCEPVATTTE